MTTQVYVIKLSIFVYFI